LQELKQLSRDPNAAERARRAEKRADAEAGLRVLDHDTSLSTAVGSGSGGGGGGGGGGSGGGFKKGGFKSSFTTVKGPAAPATPARKNVLGDDDDDVEDMNYSRTKTGAPDRPDAPSSKANRSGKENDRKDAMESDTDEEYGKDDGGGYYDPRRPTDCFPGCVGAKDVTVAY
jgi:hypothetical protein